MNIKRFIFNRLFNKRQRMVIWHSVLFSEHTYKRRGNVEAAANVRTVINEIIKVAGTEQQRFYESEVAEIVKKELHAANNIAQKRIENAYNEGKSVGFKQAVEEMKAKGNSAGDGEDGGKSVVGMLLGFAKPVEVDLEKCNDCEKKDDCPIKSAVEKAEIKDETEEGEEKKETLDDLDDAPDYKSPNAE